MVSPHDSRRVRASSRSEPSPQRSDTGVSLRLTPPFVGERLLPHPVVRACFQSLTMELAQLINRFSPPKA
jgi:hypothetical protein